MSDDISQKPIQDIRNIETENVDELVMELRDIDGIEKVDSDLNQSIRLIFYLTDLDQEIVREVSDIPEAVVMLLFKAQFIPTDFDQEYSPVLNRFLPVIWFEDIESVAAKASDFNE